MENPHEQVQSSLLARIINNVERLNESVVILNDSLRESSKDNLQVELVAQMWENYQANADFNLEATNNKRPPL